MIRTPSPRKRRQGGTRVPREQIEAIERQMIVAAMAGRDDALDALMAKRAALTGVAK